MSTAAGVSVATRAAIVAAAGPAVRRTMAYNTAIVATPKIASGSRIDHELRPNRRTDRPIAIVASGGLSTVMKFDGSSEPHNHADQSDAAACAAIE